MLVFVAISLEKQCNEILQFQNFVCFPCFVCLWRLFDGFLLSVFADAEEGGGEEETASSLSSRAEMANASESCTDMSQASDSQPNSTAPTSADEYQVSTTPFNQCWFKPTIGWRPILTVRWDNNVYGKGIDVVGSKEKIKLCNS